MVPLVQTGPNDWLLELFHGPTLAFKDVAMQLIGGLFEAALARSGRHVTIVGATSGDTGSAAIEAFRGKAGVEIFILFPDGRVSDVQRRQMTTATESNVHALAIAGDFDDAQARLKDLFNDHAFRDGVGLAGVNSINWARVLAQVVYYFTAAVALGAPHRAGQLHRADRQLRRRLRRLGGEAHGPADRPPGHRDQPERHPAPDARNRRAPPRGGRARRSARPWTSRSARTSSACSSSSSTARAAATASLMRELGQGGFDLPQGALARLRADFDSASASEDETRAAIAETFRATGRLVCPHTAVGIHAARVRRGDPAVPMVVLATAHPAKFPDAVEAATGIRPALPPRLADLMTRPERATRVPNDIEAIKDVIGREAVR